jgi:hypothetical protein
MPTIDAYSARIQKIAAPVENDAFVRQCFNPFKQHIEETSAFLFFSDWENLGDIKFTKQTYHNICQHILEKETPNPSNQIDWALVHEVRRLFRKKILDIWAKTLEKINDGQDIVSFVAQGFDNWLIYNQLYPNAPKNPWDIPNNILQENGMLYFLCDDINVLSGYSAKIKEHWEKKITLYSSKLMMVGVNKNQEKIEPLQNIEKIQEIILRYLNDKYTTNHKYASPKVLSEVVLEKMKLVFDKEWNRPAPNDDAKSPIQGIINHLHKLGLVGKSKSGFFAIKNIDDIAEANHYLKGISQKKAADFENEKATINSVLSLYEEKAKNLGRSL